jgi:hypothetical protein
MIFSAVIRIRGAGYETGFFDSFQGNSGTGGGNVVCFCQVLLRTAGIVDDILKYRRLPEIQSNLSGGAGYLASVNNRNRYELTD